MPVNFASMMLDPSPVARLDFGSAFADRDRLRLMREQFEETKRQNALDNEYRRTHEAAENARAQLAAQVERDKAAAAARAKLEEARRALDAEVSKYRDAGDIEGIDALAPRVQALGGSFERNEAEGLPSFRITWDAEQAAQAEDERAAQASPYYTEGPPPSGSIGSMEEMLAAGGGTDPMGESALQSLDRLSVLGYPSLSERGNLDEPALDSPISTEQAFNRGLAATEQYAQTGRPVRGRDQADIMGAVPTDTIDFGAQQAQVMRRLKPSLDAYRASYPETYQGSVGNTNEAVAGMALPGPKAFEQAIAMRAGPDAALGRELAAERDADKRAADANKPLTRPEQEKLSNSGYKKGFDLAKDRGLHDIVGRQKSAAMILDVLGNKVAWDDPMVGFQLTKMLGSIGAQSNRDIDIALGGDGMSTVDQIKEKFVAMLRGGYSDPRREGIMNIVKRSAEIDDDQVRDLMDTIDSSAAAEKDPEVRRGWLQFKKSLPQDYLDAHEEYKRENGLGDPEELEEEEGEEFEEEPAPRQGTTEVERVGQAGPVEDDDEFMDELFIQAEESGLDPNAILAVVGGESRGKADAANSQSSAKGLIQFLNSTARRYGFGSSKDFAQLSRTEQLPYIMQYLKDSGLGEDSDPEDYGVAVAAPAFVGKPDDTVVYREGTEQHRINQPWWPQGGGDITVGSIKDYYARHGAARGAQEPDEEPAEDESDLDAEVLGILR